MSYAMVWLNGTLVGGWPYGYNSWRLDLSSYLYYGADNQLAIRLDNPNYSSRWYPGAGIYRNVWLTKTNAVHIGQWGSYVTTSDVSEASATIKLNINIDNDSESSAIVVVNSEVYELSATGEILSEAVGSFPSKEVALEAKGKAVAQMAMELNNPKLWGPRPQQRPHLYKALTTLSQNGKIIDRYETEFGIRDIQMDPNQGLIVNGELIKITI